MKFRLPYPPTVNHYQGKRVVLPSSAAIDRASRSPFSLAKWLRESVHVQVYDTKEAQDFKWEVRSIVGAVQPIEGTCSISLTFLPPDRRRRDSDNLFKCVFDALQFANVVKDDSQFKVGSWVFGEPVEGGAVVVEVDPVSEPQEKLL